MFVCPSVMEICIIRKCSLFNNITFIILFLLRLFITRIIYFYLLCSFFSFMGNHLETPQVFNPMEGIFNSVDHENVSRTEIGNVTIIFKKVGCVCVMSVCPIK